MSDDLEHFGMVRRPDPSRPLQGMTVLVVEDSRYASEAIRLLCLRSGARIRRADTLAAAHRHLSVYRPSAAIIDLGLPDGDGCALIRELDAANPRISAIVGLSGDDSLRERAMMSGADDFFAKPIENLAHFQQSLLDLMPVGEGPRGPRVVPDDIVTPDPVALQDDFAAIADALKQAPEGDYIDYIAHFVSGVARSAHDNALEKAASQLASTYASGGSTGSPLARIAGLIDERMAQAQVI
jgi:CheY-like chemotaxis protein